MAVKVRKTELECKKAVLPIAVKKLGGLEDKVLNDMINGDTYKRATRNSLLR